MKHITHTIGRPLRRPARKAKHTLRLLSSVGWHYTCPCCGWSFNRMYPHGHLVQRPNARCPHCGSLERHRLLWLYLHAKPELFAGQLRLLHVAPEPIFRRYFQSLPNVTYISCDIAARNVLLHTDLTAIPHPDASFDAIVCYHVLEHIPADHQAMRELRRVLKPGGWAILQSPLDPTRATTYEDWSITAPEDRLHAFGQEDHVRIYGRDYKDRLEQAGFHVSVDMYVQQLGAAAIERYRLSPNEAIYMCRA